MQGINSFVLKKKIGKDKFSGSKKITSLLVSKNNIIFSDDRGTIYYVNENTKIKADKVEIDLLYKKLKISMINKKDKVNITSKY